MLSLRRAFIQRSSTSHEIAEELPRKVRGMRGLALSPNQEFSLAQAMLNDTKAQVSAVYCVLLVQEELYPLRIIEALFNTQNLRVDNQLSVSR